MKSFFARQQVKNEIENLYHDKLDELSIQYEFLNVETSFGDTNIVRTGKRGMPPLVLVHGANGCAPVAIEALLELLDDYCVYAIDVVGQPNLSAEVRPSMHDHSYGQWMFEVLTRLNIREVILVGISFGGFICLKTLAHDEKRIARAFLIVPAGVVQGHPLKALSQVFLPMKIYRWWNKESYLHRFLSALFSERDEFATRFLGILFRHYSMDTSPIPLIKKEVAGIIKTPVYFIAAENDILFPGEKMLARARSIFQNIPEVLLLKNSKHVPGKMDNQKIADFIKKQLSA